MCHPALDAGSRYMKDYFVYILSSRKNGTLYVGVTDDLIRRVYEHKNVLIDGFTKEHQIHNLVYFESTPDPISAISREKTLKRWKRAWKLRLIEESNPEWKDLYKQMTS